MTDLDTARLDAWQENKWLVTYDIDGSVVLQSLDQQKYFMGKTLREAIDEAMNDSL